MAETRTKSRIMLVVLLAVGLLAAVGTLGAVFVNSSDRTPAVTASASPTTAPTPMTSEEARSEYYRQHPRATGWWQWILIGGLIAALVVVGLLLITKPRPDRRT
ncbi:hypothetical protein [Cryptosporangium phraense]|uniref:Uncharacterized protein n=1 Tax=Cryptosporangium phraense TaxID=2593070 RepID=A0A545AIC4_9ACTN|nr:hypothetical protein [Cryptosporangium phraense]TQS41072.1 hypothetical protein FL583_31415 [Cryptosporangium phraense]